MDLKSQFLLLTIVLSFFASYNYFLVSAANNWEPMMDRKNSKVIKLAKFAVTEHNRHSHTDLVFDRVVAGAVKTDGPKVHVWILIDAKNGNSMQRYNATLLREPWRDHTSLVSFRRK
ncbi:hypothetical protein CDL12_06007 [Handroanthus impetiginosus]|uniref:Cystatin domain-containing protein n=1 Tax=Handroanthus impetiginosus TaxID=429701 RepID=A0A2G9HUV3_9LAMI|nr:hypothetical protein CDL12_06007 [Handroanthus impetiginosus]